MKNNYLNIFNSKIVKAAKGWWASEMNTWTPEQQKQILEQYGKEGLTPNTYAWLTARVNKASQQSNTQQSSNTQQKPFTNDQVKEMQRDLGVKEDGLYGKETIQAMYKKYGTSDFNKAYSQMSHKTSQASPSTGGNKSTKSASTGGKQYTQQSSNHQTNPSKETNITTKSEDKGLQKGVDYRGGVSYTDTRIQANKKNSKNKVEVKHLSDDEIRKLDFGFDPSTAYSVQQAPMDVTARTQLYSDSDAAERDVALKQIQTTAKNNDVEGNKTAVTNYHTTVEEQHKKQEDLKKQENNKKYGEGNWAYNESGELITRKFAPDISESVFNIPQEWSDFAESTGAIDYGHVGYLQHRFEDTYLGGKLFGRDTGFHRGSWLLGTHDYAPMDLSEESSLEDAYTKAYAAGNRTFIYGGKKYNTTSYTKTAHDYLQAQYDAEYEKQTTGKISEKTQKKLNDAKIDYATDEMKRFGINNFALRGESSSGYPLEKNFNIANNVGQFGYNHGVARMITAANGYQDLSVNNRGANGTNITIVGDQFKVGDQVLNSKQSTHGRSALFKIGVSQPLEPNSPELNSVYFNKSIQPSSFQNSAQYAYSIRENDNTGFRPKSNWGDASALTGNYTRVGTQRGGTMWNATQVYDPNRNITYLYDVNDYAFGPNSFIGWGGYTGIPVVGKSSGKPSKLYNGGKLNYLQYFN